MGLMPVVQGMPLRLTATQQNLKEYALFKSTRCTLPGWQLHPVDEARLQNFEGHGIKLQHTPAKLCIRFQDATWVSDARLRFGAVAIPPCTVVWALDKQWQCKVRQKRLPLASDFSGTTHSFAGATLKAAMVDCSPWTHEPSVDDQLMGYMCLSRVEHKETSSSCSLSHPRSSLAETYPYRNVY